MNTKKIKLFEAILNESDYFIDDYDIKNVEFIVNKYNQLKRVCMFKVIPYFKKLFDAFQVKYRDHKFSVVDDCLVLTIITYDSKSRWPIQMEFKYGLKDYAYESNLCFDIIGKFAFGFGLGDEYSFKINNFGCGFYTENMIEDLLEKNYKDQYLFMEDAINGNLKEVSHRISDTLIDNGFDHLGTKLYTDKI